MLGSIPHNMNGAESGSLRYFRLSYSDMGYLFAVPVVNIG